MFIRVSSYLFLWAFSALFVVIVMSLLISGVYTYEYSGDICLDKPINERYIAYITPNDVIGCCGDNKSLVSANFNSNEYYPDLATICKERGYDVFLPWRADLSLHWAFWIFGAVGIVLLISGIITRAKGN